MADTEPEILIATANKLIEHELARVTVKMLFDALDYRDPDVDKNIKQALLELIGRRDREWNKQS